MSKRHSIKTYNYIRFIPYKNKYLFYMYITELQGDI